jgi:multidrug efflux pump subunit AcrA (membrane-fusion protein)
MAVRKSNIDDTVSLFSFLDIMACLIGILVLMIVIVTLSQISQPQADSSETEQQQEQALAEARERAEQYRAARQQITADLRRQEQLTQLIREAEAVKEQLTSTREVVNQLDAQQAAALRQQSTTSEQAAQLQAEIDRLQTQTQQATQRQQELQQQIAELRKELAEREQPQEAEVKIQPSGSGLNFNAVFVECAATSIVLHDGPQPLRIPRGEITTRSEFRRLMDKVKQDPQGNMVFLVRPDGVATYNVARNFVRSNYVKNGKLAIAGQGPIDLSLFQQAAVP